MTCAAGTSCRAGIQLECDDFSYCEDNEEYPYGQLCPAGTYLLLDDNDPEKVSERGLTDRDGTQDVRGVSVYGCRLCPAGKFCLGGRIAGDCAPGYVCLYGAPSPTPSGEPRETFPVAEAYACPMGFYCPAGTEVELRCEAGLYTYREGARQKDECTTCVAGYWCGAGADGPEICPEGHYCPPGSEEPTACPVGRFNPSVGQSHRDDCLPCTEGYYCTVAGLGDFSADPEPYSCPLGEFCPTGTLAPAACPAGTYSDQGTPGPGSADACTDCPEHYYCPRQCSDPTPCPDGTSCPAGAGAPVLCEAGYYCQSSGTSVEVSLCPEGSYCPVGSVTPIACDDTAGEVCPEGSISPAYSALSADSCLAGEFFGYGRCNPCEAGFVCEGSTTERFPLDLER